MSLQESSRVWAILILLSVFHFGCATAPKVVVLPEPEVVKIPIIVKPQWRTVVPEGSRIFVAGVSGKECAEEVKDALMRRLIDNADYDVLSRDNLDQIFTESNLAWGGSVNTQTANRLGELVGASLFIVGRVGYCGVAASDSIDSKAAGHYTVLAALQLIDIETGKVILSSSAEGHYVPRPLPLALAEGIYEPPGEAGDVEVIPPPRGWRRLLRPLRWIGGKLAAFWDSMSEPQTATDQELKPEPESYLRVKAAEDMANGFADKFFARPTWETVEMWESERWHYGDAIRYVKLGYCSRAVQLLETIGEIEVPRMAEREIGEYLHNFGVALLCANKAESAEGKLRAAYRVGYSQSSLKMAGLASRVREWSLDVEINTEPVIEMLFERDVVIDDPGLSSVGQPSAGASEMR